MIGLIPAEVPLLLLEAAVVLHLYLRKEVPLEELFLQP